MKTDYDILILGSGFGGSLLSMVAKRLGRSVLLLEKGRHPRFAIGESTSPLTNLLIEQLAERYDLPRLLPLTTYGQWQKAYPEVSCGLKRGFTYYHHRVGQPYHASPDHDNQLLVAASPNDAVADTHWFRADVDRFLMQEAIALGVDYLDETTVTGVEWGEEGAMLTGNRQGEIFHVRARFVVDATGPRGFLSRTLNLPEVPLPDYPPTQALFSHFLRVRRCDEMETFRTEGTPPYAPDDAALHHVFDGGWMWVLRLNNGVTSAGFAVKDWLAEDLRLAEGEPAWRRFLQRYPSIGEQFAEAEAVQPFVHAPRLSYRCSDAAGPGWAMLPSAAGFLDPLFSTGFPLALLGIERLGRILAEAWETPAFADRLQEYAQITLGEIDATSRLIAGSYATFHNFPRFADYAMFYFAAASFSEMARRLGKGELVRRYLAADHPTFGPALRECGRRLQQAEREGMVIDGEFAQGVAAGIAPLNIAGLCDSGKQNWYPVDLNDLILEAAKLEHTPDQMRQILAVAPWA